MATSMWAKAVKVVSEHVVFIETTSGRGTGFVVPAPPGSTGLSAVSVPFSRRKKMTLKQK